MIGFKLNLSNPMGEIVGIVYMCVCVCVLTRQHLVQVDSQQKVEDTVHNQHKKGHVKRMGAVGQGGKHSTISLGLQVDHLT